MEDAALERLRIALEQSGRSMKEVSLAAKLGETFVRDVLKREYDPSVSKLSKVAGILGTTVAAIMNDERTKTVPLVGYIEDGGAVFFVKDEGGKENLGEVEAPPGNVQNTVAVLVKSDSALGIVEQGWTVYYSTDDYELPPDVAGTLCVVWLEDGTVFVRKVYPGKDSGHWNLLQLSSYTLLENVRIIRAAPVLWMRPDQRAESAH